MNNPFVLRAPSPVTGTAGAAFSRRRVRGFMIAIAIAVTSAACSLPTVVAPYPYYGPYYGGFYPYYGGVGIVVGRGYGYRYGYGHGGYYRHR